MASHRGRPVTQKLIRVKSDPAGSFFVAIIDPAGFSSDPPLQKVIRVQILVDTMQFFLMIILSNVVMGRAPFHLLLFTAVFRGDKSIAILTENGMHA